MPYPDGAVATSARNDARQLRLELQQRMPSGCLYVGRLLGMQHAGVVKVELFPQTAQSATIYDIPFFMTWAEEESTSYTRPWPANLSILYSRVIISFHLHLSLHSFVPVLMTARHNWHLLTPWK